jgi:Xaa-Pro aminopeptidase
MDKLIRFALLTRGGQPILWDFGSAAKHHQLHNPWLMDGEEPRAGPASPRCVAPSTSTPASLTRSPPRSSVSSTPPAWPTSRSASTLLTHAAAMVDAAYEDLYEFLRPGVRENETVGLVAKKLYDLGSECVEGVNAISGERCSPHPHVYSDRLIRPGDPAFFDILHSFNGYRTCYYRTFAVGPASRAQRDAYTRAREYMDIATVRPSATTADIVRLWPTAAEFGFPDEEDSFGLQYGHGVGLSIWEKSIFSRLVSLDHPETIEEGMVFALETYWPSADGVGAARIEEELVESLAGSPVPPQHASRPRLSPHHSSCAHSYGGGVPCLITKFPGYVSPQTSHRACRWFMSVHTLPCSAGSAGIV